MAITDSDLGCIVDRAPTTCPILHLARRWQSSAHKCIQSDDGSVLDGAYCL